MSSVAVLDADFVTGETRFTFPNGDVYEGEFCAHRSGLVWREGRGMYTTMDGHVYIGRWYNDGLVEKEDVEVEFPKGARYVGPLVKNKYGGPGVYVLENKLEVLCNFQENKPTGEFLLIDMNNCTWYGEPVNHSTALIQPEHVFYAELNCKRGKGRAKIKKKIGKVQSKANKTLKRSERDVFAKSTKTVDDIGLEESVWWRNYERFKENYQEIMRKVNKYDGVRCLNELELKWFNGYVEFEKNFMNVKNKKPLSKSLLMVFNSREFQESCPPVSVFYSNVKKCNSDLSQ